MHTRDLIDPDLLPLAESFPSFEPTQETLADLRLQAEAMAVEADAVAVGVSREEILIPGLANEPDVECLIYRRSGVEGLVPGFVQIHGGGMVMNSARSSDARNVATCAALGITIVSVDYRLAPENPYPAALNDCFAALAWMHRSATTLGIDAARIAVGGDSAGGGLAASVCQKARGTEFEIAFQHLVYPMLDDRTTLAGQDLDPNLGEIIWTPNSNRFGWSAYIGSAAPEEAVPARAQSLAGLPPTWIAVGGLDLFLDEDIAYARRLMRHGIATELQVYPGAFHGFPFAVKAPVAQRFERDYRQSLARGLGLKVS